MATVLMTWELGGGLGHTSTLSPLAKGLVEHGHRVWVALKNLTGAREVFDLARLAYLQAPIQTGGAADRVAKPHTFAHILQNVGFGEANGLPVRIEAWQHLFELVRPELIVFDHSPTAVLAARGLPAGKVVVGTGFCCPPDVYPLPDLRTWEPGDPASLRDDEDRLLGKVNALLKSRGQPPLDRVGRLFGEVDECLLTTIRELDHSPRPSGGRYWGAWSGVPGKPPQWPDVPGKRIFAYLKPFKAIRALLARLNKLACPTIIFTRQLSQRLREQYASATLRFENEPLDVEQVGRQCQLAILNGTHGTTFRMLLAGVPTLQLPLFMEQAITARKVADLGAGLAAPLDRPQDIVRRLDALLTSDTYARRAREIASRYAGFDPGAEIQKAVDRLEELLAR